MSKFNVNVNVTLPEEYEESEPLDISVNLRYKVDDIPLVWTIADSSIYGIGFYEELLKAMELSLPCRESGGGNSGSYICFNGSNLAIGVECSGSGGDQDVTLQFSKSEGISIVKQIIEGYYASSKQILAQLKV